MAVADDLDHATDSQWDWVAEQTRAYLATGGAEGSGPGTARGPGRAGATSGADDQPATRTSAAGA
ncbi:hypothetical protein ACFFQW_11145 [Umezawaea endophytica]|uniref:Uncharacterized protein n=1 Tax=Umezawaea endophytica TaxID=1654476 RepID=A0A9X2VK73_9PSEU|nr:hypothetical protein [Umezawaea endophytica]MCS7478047.1 hypothetical protein [Umezawaea endophytica]